MSIESQIKTETQISNVLEMYDITVNGFLPQVPIEKLSDPVHQMWENLVDELPTLNKENALKNKISEIDDFDLSLLKEPWQHKRAYVILSMITNSYVMGDKQQIMQLIPNKLAKPLCYVSNYLGINPILTHAAVDLYNWYLADPNGSFDLDNLRSKNLMTGTEDEERFYLVMVSIEQIGGLVINSLMSMLYSDIDTTISSIDKTTMIGLELITINESITKMINVIKRIREKCNPKVFYNVLRPFLSGWENNEKIPDGMLYEGVYEERKFYCGGSAAQSSLFQVLDAAFGVSHADKYFERIRNYMPKTHRAFIEFVKQNIDVKKIISNNDFDGKNAKLYQSCVTNLMTFRSCHMNIVKEYILTQIPSKGTDDVKGTGGTVLVTFLNDSIKNTREAIHQ